MKIDRRAFLTTGALGGVVAVIGARTGDNQQSNQAVIFQAEAEAKLAQAAALKRDSEQKEARQ